MKINLNERNIELIENLKYIVGYVFQALLILFLITILAQQFYPDFVKSIFNINWFMIIVIVFGALSILFPHQQSQEIKKPISWKDITFILSLGIIGGIIIFLKLKSIGWIGYVISILGGLIIILLSWLVLTED
jgi:hypothetical protein